MIVGMQAFTKKIQAVVDVGSHSIRVILFDVREGAPAILDKKVVQLSAQADAERIALTLRELLYEMVKKFERVPSKIIVGLGPEMGKESLVAWTARPPERTARVDRETARRYFENLAEQYKNTGEAFVAYPAGVLINRYPVSLDGGISVERFKELQFQVLLLNILARAGSLLADAKRSLGGMPIEFMPLAAAHREAFARGMGVENALLVDIGGENTSLTLLKEKRVAGFAYFSPGSRHFVRGLGREASLPYREAQDLSRHLAEKSIMREGQIPAQELEAWKKELMVSLGAFYAAGPLPPDVFVFGGGANMQGIAPYLAKGEWLDKYSYVRSPNVKVARAESFFEGSTLGGALTGPENVGLAALILYSLYHKPLL